MKSYLFYEFCATDSEFLSLFAAFIDTKRPFALLIAVAIPPGMKRVRTISKIPRIRDPVGPCNHRSGTKAIDCVEDAQSGINA